MAFCVAVGPGGDIDSSGGPGGGGNAFIYNEGTWSQPFHLDGLSDSATVSCTSRDFCVVAGGDGNSAGYLYEYRNGGWSAQQDVSDVMKFNNVSCASPNFCLAVGETNNSQTALVYEYKAGSWTGPVNASSGPLSEFDSVSCPTDSFCMLEGVNSAALDVNGNWAWSGPSQLLANVTSISCSTASFCMAVGGNADTDTSGDAVAYSSSS